MAEKLTPEEVKKALECCISDENCESCPLHHEKIENACTLTVVEFYKEILDLINRQQAENKELKTENLILSQKRFNIFERIEFTDKLKKQAKSEAIKEFAERLKEHLKGNGGLYCVTTMNAKIDNLVKEMVGEK